MFNSSRRVASDILYHAGIFWGSPYSTETYEKDEDWVPPSFNAEDAIHVSESMTGLANLLRNQSFFPQLTPELFLDIAKSIGANEDGSMIEGSYHGIDFDILAEAFSLGTTEDKGEYIHEILATGHNDILWGFYHKFKEKQNPAMEIFRANIDQGSYLFTQSIVDSNLGEEHAILGITSAGEEGLNQLRGAIRGIQRFIATDSKNAEDYALERRRIDGSPVYERLWRAAVRFDQSVWGNTSTNEISRILRQYELFAAFPEEAPEILDTEIYKDSEVVSVRERDKSSGNGNLAAKQVIDRLCEVARHALGSEKPDDGYGEPTNDYNQRIYDLHQRVLATHTLLVDKIRTAKDRRKRLRIQEQLDAYESVVDGEYMYDLMDGIQSGGFAAAYDKLRSIKGMRGALREKAIRDAKNTLGDELDEAFNNLLKYSSGIDRLTAATDMVDHLIIQEHLLKQRPNDAEYEWFIKNKLFNMSIVRAETERFGAQRSLTASTRQFRFVPNRDIGLELSGQIGDACWASKYGSVAESMPNLSAVLITEKAGEEEKFVGSGLFIEATSEDGEELLIIRGLNPIQNVINQLDANDFLEKYIDFAADTANRANRRLAIVFDNVGGASTNRPNLHKAIETLITRRKPQQIRVPAEQVEFNTYELEDSIYAF